MSNYLAVAIHPKELTQHTVEMMDDHYGIHMYGVRFPNGDVFPPAEVKMVEGAEPDPSEFPEVNKAIEEAEKIDTSELSTETFTCSNHLELYDLPAKPGDLVIIPNFFRDIRNWTPQMIEYANTQLENDDEIRKPKTFDATYICNSERGFDLIDFKK